MKLHVPRVISWHWSVKSLMLGEGPHSSHQHRANSSFVLVAVLGFGRNGYGTVTVIFGCLLLHWSSLQVVSTLLRLPKTVLPSSETPAGAQVAPHECGTFSVSTSSHHIDATTCPSCAISDLLIFFAQFNDDRSSTYTTFLSQILYLNLGQCSDHPLYPDPCKGQHSALTLEIAPVSEPHEQGTRVKDNPSFKGYRIFGGAPGGLRHFLQSTNPQGLVIVRLRCGGSASAAHSNRERLSSRLVTLVYVYMI